MEDTALRDLVLERLLLSMQKDVACSQPHAIKLSKKRKPSVDRLVRCVDVDGTLDKNSPKRHFNSCLELSSQLSN